MREYDLIGDWYATDRGGTVGGPKSMAPTMAVLQAL
jgi:hypothetical protein